jgi:hypothetical protein
MHAAAHHRPPVTREKSRSSSVMRSASMRDMSRMLLITASRCWAARPGSCRGSRSASGIGGAAQGQVGHADDGIHRRAQFVAHVGQENALGAAGGFGGIARLRQFGGAGIHELLEVVPMLVEFPVGQLLLGDVVTDAQDTGGVGCARRGRRGWPSARRRAAHRVSCSHSRSRRIFQARPRSPGSSPSGRGRYSPSRGGTMVPRTLRPRISPAEYPKKRSANSLK